MLNLPNIKAKPNVHPKLYKNIFLTTNTATMKLLTTLQSGFVAHSSIYKACCLVYNAHFFRPIFIKNLTIGTLLAIVATLFVACGDDSKSNSSQVSNNSRSAGDNSQGENGRPKLYDFDMIDTTLKAVGGIKTRVCVAVQSEESAPNYSIRITKPPLNGSLTPLLSGTELCFDYTPNASFIGKDPFEFSVCNTSGYCLDKIWFVDVKGKIVNSRPTSVKNQTTPEIQTAPSNSSSIFDGGKKNRDNYNPNN
jgi:hypothetical protein